MSVVPVLAFLAAVAGAAVVIAGKLRTPPPPPPPATTDLCCSFCGKSQRYVKKLIAGPSVYICDECVALCVEIIAEEGAPKPPPDVKPAEHVWSPPAKD